MSLADGLTNEPVGAGVPFLLLLSWGRGVCLRRKGQVHLGTRSRSRGVRVSLVYTIQGKGTNHRAQSS